SPRARAEMAAATPGSGIGEEAQPGLGERVDHETPVEIAVGALARRFRSEETRVAGSAVEAVFRVVGGVFGAHRIGRAKARFGEGLHEQPVEHLRLAETDETAEGAFAIGRSGVEKDACHRFWTAPGVQPLADAGRPISAL